MIQTIDKSKQYMPENKIVIDIPAGLNIFRDTVGIVNHVKELTEELSKTWNAKFAGKPEVKFANVNLVEIFNNCNSFYNIKIENSFKKDAEFIFIFKVLLFLFFSCKTFALISRIKWC